MDAFEDHINAACIHTNSKELNRSMFSKKFENNVFSYVRNNFDNIHLDPAPVVSVNILQEP